MKPTFRTYLLLLTVIIVVALYVFIQQGGFVAKGTLHLDDVPDKTVVFVDDEQTDYAPKDGLLDIALAPGEHSVLLYQDGDFPWEKTITIEEDSTTTLTPLFVHTEQKTTALPEGGRENVALLFATNQLHISHREVSLSARGGVIEARWTGATEPPYYFCNENNECPTQKTIFQTATGDITSLAFYPGRTDVALFSVGQGVYAIEIDSHGTQNFFPIYKGTSPTIATDSEKVYVFDNGVIRQINL